MRHLAGSVLLLLALGGCTSGQDSIQSPGGGDEVDLGWKDVRGTVVRVELPMDAGLDHVRSLGTATTDDAADVDVISFWASFCAPCRRELPWLDRLDQAGQVDVLGVSRDVRVEVGESALRAANVTFANFHDPDGTYMRGFHDLIPPNALPVLVLMDAGRPTWVHVGGFDSYAQLRDAVLDRG